MHRNTVTARAPGGWSCAAVGRDLAVGGAGGPGTAWRPRAVRAPTSAHDALSRRVMTQLRRQSSSPGDISVTVTWPAVKAGCEALQAHEEALLLPRQAGILQPQGAVSPELQQSFCQEVMFRKQSQVREAQLPLLRQATCMQLAQPVDLLRWRCEGLCIARAQSVVDRVNDVVDHAPQCLRHCVGGATDTPASPRPPAVLCRWILQLWTTTRRLRTHGVTLFSAYTKRTAKREEPREGSWPACGADHLPLRKSAASLLACSASRCSSN